MILRWTWLLAWAAWRAGGHHFCASTRYRNERDSINGAHLGDLFKILFFGLKHTDIYPAASFDHFFTRRRPPASSRASATSNDDPPSIAAAHRERGAQGRWRRGASRPPAPCKKSNIMDNFNFLDSDRYDWNRYLDLVDLLNKLKRLRCPRHLDALCVPPV